MTDDEIAERIEHAVDTAVARVMIGDVANRTNFTSTMVARAAIAAHTAARSLS